MASREVAVAMGAFDATVVGPGGEVVVAYECEVAVAPTDSAGPLLQPRLPCGRPGGLRDSAVRAALPDGLVAFLDSEQPSDLRADLRTIRDVAARRGRAAAVEGACARRRPPAASTQPPWSCRSRSRRPGTGASCTTSRSTLQGTTGPSGCWREAPPVPRIPDAEREEFSSRTRSLFISRATIAWFLEDVPPGQLAACSGMLARAGVSGPGSSGRPASRCPRR